jgi:isopentenyl-diphosphate Delta-isomerase
MPDSTTIETRKSDHIRINLEEDVRSGLTTGLDALHFVHEALPEVNLDEIDLSQVLFGRPVRSPILISSMTGGTQEASNINRILAEAAQTAGIAMGVGSQRAALEQSQQTETFAVRKYAPDALILANLGAVQFNYGYGVEHCQRAVDMVEADGLFLHLNSMQEAIQPGGDTRFGGLLAKIEKVCRALPVPVIIKEVGWGISDRTARLLGEAGVAAIDVAGAGGTSWTQVEMYRLKDPKRARIAAAFRDWGIPTSQSIQMVRQALPEMKIFASGGLKSGVDIAKCIALGAALGGMAGPFLKSASGADPLQATLELIDEYQEEIRICMFGIGAANMAGLQSARLVKYQE